MPHIACAYREGATNVLGLLRTFGALALVLGLVGVVGVLTGRNLMYIYFVALFLSIVLGFWAGCMVLSHADEGKHTQATHQLRVMCGSSLSSECL